MSAVQQVEAAKTWSPYQDAVFAWGTAHRNKSGALIVEAVAGSGKTTTVVEFVRRCVPTHHRVVFLAFNKPVATELSARLPSSAEAKTLNSLGFGAVRKAIGSVQIDDKKTFKLIDQLMQADGIEMPREAVREIASLVSKAKAHALVPVGGKFKGYEATHERWGELIDRYDLDLGDVEIAIANRVLQAGLDQRSIIDFDDQLYFVVALDLQCFQYDWIIVDEAQDVSHVQRLMLKKFLKPHGRLIAVGDSRQAIYGFRGADSDALDNLRKTFKADVLPLSITYRCARNIVESARRYMPSLEAAPNAPSGIVKNLAELDGDSLTPADMVLCRYTAPILSTAYALIGRRIPCRVEGRDIGVGLVSLIKRVAGKQWTTLSIEQFLTKLDAWRTRELEKAQAKEDEAKINAIDDKYQSIRAVMDASGAQSVPAIISEVEKLFTSTQGVRLSTIHRSKGLEADRVYVLEAQAGRRKMQEWQLQQEQNLLYVACTRAKTELYFVPAKAVA